MEHLEIKLLHHNYFAGPEWVFANLSAPYWRLYWHAFPGAWMTWREKSIATTPDLFTIIAPSTPFKAHGLKKAHHFYAHFLAGFPFNAISNCMYSFSPGPADLAAVGTIADKIVAGTPGRVEDQLACISLCAAGLARVPVERRATEAADPRVLAAEAFMTENIGRTVSNAELARVVHMAPNAFIRFFRGATGLSPQRRFAHRKIERARLMLQYHDDKIEQVAEALGFADRYYFTRVFTKVTGTSPAAYRKTARAAGS